MHGSVRRLWSGQRITGFIWDWTRIVRGSWVSEPPENRHPHRMRQYPECLICFEPNNMHWRPPTHCECRIAVHQACWEEWVQKVGQICIICRKGEHQLPDPMHAVQPQVNIIVLQNPNTIVWNQYGPWIIILFLTWWLFMQKGIKYDGIYYEYLDSFLNITTPHI